jgi:hypothetical protein
MIDGIRWASNSLHNLLWLIKVLMALSLVWLTRTSPFVRRNVLTPLAYYITRYVNTQSLLATMNADIFLKYLIRDHYVGLIKIVSNIFSLGIK